jgi:DNA-binding MarR family transcriptional regulator
LTSGAITGVVNRLVARGLAVREPDPDDARRVRISPAPEPSRELEAVMGPLGDRLLDTLSPFDDCHREALAAWLAEATRVISAEALRVRHLD